MLALGLFVVKGKEGAFIVRRPALYGHSHLLFYELKSHLQSLSFHFFFREVMRVGRHGILHLSCQIQPAECPSKGVHSQTQLLQCHPSSWGTGQNNFNCWPRFYSKGDNLCHPREWECYHGIEWRLIPGRPAPKKCSAEKKPAQMFLRLKKFGISLRIQNINMNVIFINLW